MLIANDRWLKGTLWAPTWFTGKASDFAGLFVVLPLVAVAARVRTVRGLAGATLVVGALFSLLKTSHTASAGYERAFALVHARNVVDPTDLLALPMLVVSAWYVARTASAPRSAAFRAKVGAVVAAPFCLATSAPPPPPCALEGALGCTEPMAPPTANFAGTFDTAPLTVRIRSAPAACDVPASCALPAFTTDEVRTLPVDENIALPGAPGGCYTYALDLLGDEYPTIVLAAGPGAERVPRSVTATVTRPGGSLPALPGGVLLSRVPNGTLAVAVGASTIALCVEEAKP